MPVKTSWRPTLGVISQSTSTRPRSFTFTSSKGRVPFAGFGARRIGRQTTNCGEEETNEGVPRNHRPDSGGKDAAGVSWRPYGRAVPQGAARGQNLVYLL